MIENDIAHKVIGIALDVHRALGPGLLESAYKECLAYKLIQTGLFIEKEKPMPWFLKKLNSNVVIGLIYLLKRNWCLN